MKGYSEGSYKFTVKAYTSAGEDTGATASIMLEPEGMWNTHDSTKKCSFIKEWSRLYSVISIAIDVFNYMLRIITFWLEVKNNSFASCLMFLLYVCTNSWLAAPGNLDFSWNHGLIFGHCHLHLLQETEMVRLSISCWAPCVVFQIMFFSWASEDNSIYFCILFYPKGEKGIVSRHPWAKVARWLVQDTGIVSSLPQPLCLCQ